MATILDSPTRMWRLISTYDTLKSPSTLDTRDALERRSIIEDGSRRIFA